MGVKGLMSYLKGLQVQAVEEPLPENSTLLIDGSGWMFSLFDETNCKGIGGGYDVFREVIVREVLYLRETLGFHLVVYFDGPESQLKAGTRESRRLQREEKWLTLCSLISGHASAISNSTGREGRLKDAIGRRSANQRDLPLPVLVSEQLKQTLSSMKVEVVSCVGEADQQLALDCVARNTSTKDNIGCAFVYAEDSDYLLMRDVPYIRLSTSFDQPQRTLTDEARSHTVGRVWRRAHVAGALDLTEKQLVEFAIAIGNDFTAPFSRSLFPNLALGDESQGQDPGSLEILRRYIISQGTSFFLYSLTPELNLAIDFSRALYELQDLSKFPLDPPPGNFVAGTVNVATLSNQLVSLLDIYLDGGKEAKSQHFKPPKTLLNKKHMLGKVALGFMQSLLRSKDGKQSCSNNTRRDLSGLYSVDILASLGPSHLQVLADMLTILQSRELPSFQCSKDKEACSSDENSDDDQQGKCTKLDKMAEVHVANSLDGFFSAHIFQLICKQLLRQCRRSITTASKKQKGPLLFPWHEPCAIFDAKLYYALLEGSMMSPHAHRSVDAFLLSSGLGTPSKNITSIDMTKATSVLIKGDDNCKSTGKKSKALLSLLKGGSAQPIGVSGIKIIPSICPVAETENTSSGPSNTKNNPIIQKQEDNLPIDSYKDEIIFRVNRDPVTIIFGETGCGKSSRLPIMLLRHAQATNKPFRMMVSQPRRIAVSSLYKRVKETLGDQVGMRMGHGVREESHETKIYFVTTGYLVRLLAHKPDAMKNHTHIIIDEVHERSVDGDVVCLLVRRLLERFPHIKVILMSATIHTDLYKTYFSVGDSDEMSSFAVDPNKQHNILEEPGPVDGSRDMAHCLFVGSRRFPLDIRYLDTLDEYIRDSPGICLITNRLIQACAGGMRRGGLSSDKNIHNSTVGSIQFIKDQHTLAVQLISKVANLGSSLLVFVSGMSDILELTEKLGHASGHYNVIAIHSEIPFEEQEIAFLPTSNHEIKIILATNAAESSITLPDVDVIICLGMHKAISYNLERHHSVLSNTWVSKASATQRAGRTGRVRPGRVFRLYTQQLFAEFMSEYGEPEILRVPLQETILNMRVMLESSAEFNGVVPLLEDMLEPPDVRNVEQSFKYLHSAGMIDEPSDEGVLTSTGNFVGSLPVGIVLGRLIAFGVMLGVEAEAVILAAGLSLPKSPFRIASPLVHKDPSEYNAIVQRIFLAASTFDNGVYSEPLMLMNLLLAWRKLDDVGRQKDSWAVKHGLVKSRLRYFDSVAKNLREQVSRILQRSDTVKSRSKCTESKITSNDNDVKNACSPATYNTLRLILLWTNASNNILKLSRVTKLPKNTRQLTLSGDTLLTLTQLESLFPPSKVPFNITTTSETMCVMHMASNDYLAQTKSSTRLRDILMEMLAIAVDNDFSMIPVVWLKVEELVENEGASPLANSKVKSSSKKGKNSSKKNPYEGRTARVSYMVAIASTVSDETYESIVAAVEVDITSKIELVPCHQLRNGNNSQGDNEFSSYYRMFRVEMFNVPVTTAPTSADKFLYSCFSTFHLKLSFTNKIKVIYKNSQIPCGMLHQMFHHLVPGDVELKKTQVASPSQCLDFLLEPDLELDNDSDSSTEGDEWGRATGGLIDDVALGIRLYKAYLSGLNNGKGTVMVRTPISSSSIATTANMPVVGSAAWVQEKASRNDHLPNELFPSSPVHVSSCPGMQWKNMSTTLGQSKQAFLERYSVTASMVYTGSQDLFAVAGNTLDLGGAVRCDGVTVLPPGGSWLVLALMCMHINPLPFLSPNGAQQVSDEGLMTDERLSQAEEVQRLLQRRGECNVQRNESLITLLDHIFSPWTRNDGEELEFKIVKVEDLYYYQCPQCNVRFADVTSCKRHIKKAGHVRALKMKQPSKKSLKANSSPKISSSPSLMKSTFETPTKSSPTKSSPTTGFITPPPAIATAFETPTVSTGYGNPNSEPTSKNKSRKFVCTVQPMCSTSIKKRAFSTAEGLQKHMEVKHPDVLSQQSNGVVRSGDIDLVDEMASLSLSGIEAKSKEEIISLACIVCGEKKKKRYKSHAALMDHMIGKHNIEAPGEECITYGKSKDENDDKDIRDDILSPPPPSFGTQKCNRAGCESLLFSSLALLSEHMKEVHDVDAMDDFFDTFFDGCD